MNYVARDANPVIGTRSVLMKFLGACGMVAAIITGSPIAFAEENGGAVWPLGVQTVLPALLPPPGVTQLYNYTQYYSAGALTNSNGKKAVPNFQLNVFADSLRVVHTWETKLDGLNLSTGAILAGDYQYVQAAGASTDTVGFDFFYLTPIYLTYTAGPWHLLFGPGFTVPIGPYDVHRLANPVNNYFSYVQETAVTYLTKRLEVSVEPTLTVNGTNQVTHYHSGALLDVDFGVNYQLIPSLPSYRFGFGGFYATQFTNDTISGTRVGDGYRLEQAGIGPQIVKFFGPGSGVVLKWQHDIASHNTARGDHFWLEFTFPL